MMTTPTHAHRTRSNRPGYRPALGDIMIRIKSTPGISPEVWQAVNTDVNAAVDASLEKHGLSGERTGDAVETSSAPSAAAPRSPWYHDC
jgi:hypothetical protein